jgi:hypothetical protein
MPGFGAAKHSRGGKHGGHRDANGKLYVVNQRGPESLVNVFDTVHGVTLPPTATPVWKTPGAYASSIPRHGNAALPVMTDSALSSPTGLAIH